MGTRPKTSYQNYYVEAKKKDEAELNSTKPNSAKLSRATVLVGGEGKVGLAVRPSVTETILIESGREDPWLGHKLAPKTALSGNSFSTKSNNDLFTIFENYSIIYNH